MNGKGEFQRIAALRRAFGHSSSPAVRVDNGDDGAVLSVDGDLVVTTDALVEGVDFGVFAPWDAVGHKAVAVNVSDLAAMGADPLAFVWAVCAPAAFPDEGWEQLGRGAAEAAGRWGLPCVGGDISRTGGPLTLTVTALGTVPPGQALQRRGARPGDGVYVSGECGWAAAGLELLLPAQQRPHSLAALLATFSDENTRRAVRAQVTPQPHLALGCRLRGVATAALDVSDGLVQDLAHLLFESGVGATLAAQDLPVASMLQGRPDALQKTLAGGEDFVLLFTAPPDGRAESLDKSVRRMGTVTSEKSLVVGGITLAAEDVEALHRGQMPQNPLARAWVGWRHF